jgi:hypothetical protein
MQFKVVQMTASSLRDHHLAQVIKGFHLRMDIQRLP